MKRSRPRYAATGAVLALLLAAPALFAGQPGAGGTYEEALARATARGIPLVLDFYTDW